MRRPGPTLRLGTTSATVLLGLLLAGCSFGASSVDAADLEQHVKDNVTAQEEGVELTIDCPDDLEAEVDATATCTVDDGEGETGIRFTTTEVDGDEVSFETVPFLSPETLESTLLDQLESQGFQVGELDCAEPLDGVAEETGECAVSSQGQDGSLELVVTQVDGLRIAFDWKAVG